MVIHICIKLQENILNSFQVTEWTQIYYRNHNFQSSKGCNSKSRLTRVMVLMFCTSCYDALHLYEVSSKYHVRFSSNRAYLYSVHCLMVLHTCEKFHNNILTAFNAQSRYGYMGEMAMFSVQRAITPEVGRPELRFMCSACRLILVF